MSPSCVYQKVMWRSHISEICDFFVKYGKKCVCVLMIYACGKCSESRMAGFLVYVFMIYVRRKFSEIHMVGFLGKILCASAYGCIFLCSVVRQVRVT